MGLSAEGPAPRVGGEAVLCKQGVVGGSDVDADVVVGVFGDGEFGPVAFEHYEVRVGDFGRGFGGGYPDAGEIGERHGNPPEVEGVGGCKVDTGGVL